MSRFTTCGLITVLAFAPAALAVDGTVLINQSTITNGLTGCPTGGHFPIIICQSGSYRLSGNITVPDANTDAIDITADNVTLDLNGFAVLGPATCIAGTFPVQCSTRGLGVGINAGIIPFPNNIAVSNGTVNGMGGVGVSLQGTGSRIDGLRVSNNAGTTFTFNGVPVSGIYVNVAVISNCTVTTNAGSGILIEKAGTVNLSNISFNGGFGIVAGPDVGSGVVASNNTVLTNGQDGMNNVSLAVNNSFIENIGFGFSCHDASCGFIGNVFQLNGGTVNKGTSLGHNLAGGSVF